MPLNSPLNQETLPIENNVACQDNLSHRPVVSNLFIVTS